MAVKAVVRAIIQLRDEEESIYGYEVAVRAGVASGVVYPILARLEREHCLSSTWEHEPDLEPGRPRRRVYQITEGWDPTVLL